MPDLQSGDKVQYEIRTPTERKVSEVLDAIVEATKFVGWRTSEGFLSSEYGGLPFVDIINYSRMEKLVAAKRESFKEAYIKVAYDGHDIGHPLKGMGTRFVISGSPTILTQKSVKEIESQLQRELAGR